MSSPTPDKQPSEALRRLESLPPSTAADLPPLPGQADEPEPARPAWRWYAIAGGAVGLGLVLWLVFGGPLVKPPEQKSEEAESGIVTARQQLARQTDLATVRNAIQQINAQLATDRNVKLPALGDKRRGDLQKRFDLGDEALAELAAQTYSGLDGLYLEQCLLFRDAARAIEPTNLPGVSEATLRARYLDRVRLAFAWVVRQVRLEEEAEQAARFDPLALPPGYALRRGVGSPLERALVFLALLEQLGPSNQFQGCLVFLPDKKGEPALWCAGVLLDGKSDVYLFDPRLGLPVPGQDGKGVATLREVVAEPTLLKPLTVREDAKYTTPGDDLKKAALRYVVSLSALAPRTTYLQERILGSHVPVRLVQDPTAIQTALEAATKAAGLDSQAGPWTEGKFTGPELLRRFHGREAGGTDTGQYLTLPPEVLQSFLIPAVQEQPMPRQVAWQLATVPYEHYPDVFRDQKLFPRTVGLGQRVYGAFATPFRLATETSQPREMAEPRDQILRGRYTQAAPLLIAESDQLQGQQRAFNQAARDQAAFNKAFGDWLTEAQKAYEAEVLAQAEGNAAALTAARQAIAEVWRKAGPVGVLLGAAIAGPRLPWLVYQLVLCKQEEAEARQSRLDLAEELKVTVSAADREQARKAWTDALNWGERYAQEYDGAPAQAAVRRLRARALTCLGRTEEAVLLLQDLRPPMLPLERVAALYLASKK